MKRRLITSVALLACMATQAGDSIKTTQTFAEAAAYRLADACQLWQQSRNAAGIAFDVAMPDSSTNRGVAYFNYGHISGDFHRVQDGGMRNDLQFFTERYQKIGRYLYGYGSFDFNMGRTKGRAWSDVIRSYNSNPFISGSSVFGKYDHQNIALDARLGTIPFGHFTYGAALRYEVGDLSRLRDPRSRVNLLDYRITPSVTYTFGDALTGKEFKSCHTIGLALHYDRRKEKLPSLTTVQTDATLAYYVMTGLEDATGTVGGYGGYQREYVNHEFGGELSYAYRGLRLRSVTSLTLDHGTEYVYGQYKYEPGRYYTYIYGVKTQNRLKTGGMLHALDVAATYQQAYADEYRQERVSTTDSITGYNTISWNRLMTYRKRFQFTKFDFSAHYRLSFTMGHEQRGYVGLLYLLQNVHNKRLLSTSTLDYASSFIRLEGGYATPAWGKGCRLLFDATAGYNFSTKAELNLADATTDYAVNVLIPDMDILGADYFRGSLQAEYQQPIRIGGRTTRWFARAAADYIKTNNSLDRLQLHFSVGLYY